MSDKMQFDLSNSCPFCGSRLQGNGNYFLKKRQQTIKKYFCDKCKKYKLETTLNIKENINSAEFYPFEVFLAPQ